MRRVSFSACLTSAWPGWALYRCTATAVRKTGQFTQEDPIGLAGGLNAYGFADGDPVNFSDPFGFCALPGAASSVAMGAALAAATGSKYGAGSALLDAVTGALCVGAAVKGFKLWRAGRALTQATDRVIGAYGKTGVYLQVGEAIGAKTFDIPPAVWNKMSPAAQWAANQKFLDRGIAEGAEFVMSTRRGDIVAGTTLDKEVKILAWSRL